MRTKTIGILVVVGALLAGVSVPAAQAQNYAQNPTIKPINGKTKAKKKVSIATITCGSGNCSVSSSSASVRADGKTFKASLVPVGSITSGQSVTANVKLSKKARKAVRNAGKGKLKWSLGVTSTNGRSASASGKRKLKG